MELALNCSIEWEWIWISIIILVFDNASAVHGESEWLLWVIFVIGIEMNYLSLFIYIAFTRQYSYSITDDTAVIRLNLRSMWSR